MVVQSRCCRKLIGFDRAHGPMLVELGHLSRSPMGYLAVLIDPPVEGLPSHVRHPQEQTRAHSSTALPVDTFENG